MDKIRGVNIGGWLVLEKWMTPKLYEGFDALDEYHLLVELKERREEVLKKHREEFIVEQDFEWISEHGINTVRIPVGHWLFKAEYPYISGEEYLDFAMDMCHKYGLKAIIDVHAAPGCQNGFDNGGLSNIMEWHKDPMNIDKTLFFIEELCKKYQGHPALFGIELLNEPRWDIPIEIIKDFYVRGYKIVRTYLKEEQCVMIHDAFRLSEWKDFMQTEEYINVILDTHMYQVFSHEDSIRDAFGHIETSLKRQKEIIDMLPYFPIVVGEWSLSIHNNALNALDDTQKQALYKAVGNTELLAFESSAGWFFWNYKLGPESIGSDKGWSFRNCVELGLLPNKY